MLEKVKPQRDYVLTEPRTEFYKELVKIQKYFVILSVFDGRCRKIFDLLNRDVSCQLHEAIIEGPRIIVTTPKRLSKMKPNKDSILILEEPHLLLPFGYGETLKNIRTSGFGFVALSDKVLNYDFLQDPVFLTSKRRCYVKTDHEQRYKILFSIIKFDIFDGDFVVIVTENQTRNRVRLFLKTFGYKNWDRVHILGSSIEANRVVAFSDVELKIDSTEIIYLSSVDIPGLQESKFDFSKQESFEYKIHDVLRALSPGVCNGKRRFEEKRFLSLKGILDNSGQK